MTSNTHDRREANTRASIRLKVPKFDLITRVLGCESEAARASLLGVTYITILRARNGGNVGEMFIAQTLAIFQRHAEELHRYNLKPSFDELFEVVEAAEALAEVSA